MADAHFTRDPGRRVGLVDLGAGERDASTSTGSSRSWTAPTNAASPSSSAPRRTPSRRGWPASTRRSRASGAPASASAGAPGRRSTSPTPPSASTPSGSSARSSPGTPTTRRSSASRSTTNPGNELLHNHGVFQRFVDHLRAQVRRRRDPQPRVGPGVLVAPAVDMGRPVDAGRQRPAPVRRRVAGVPGPPGHRVHRLAGRHRPRVRPARAVRHHLHLLQAPRGGGRRADRPPRHRLRQPVLRHAGRPAAARPHARTTTSRSGRPPACGRCTRPPTGCSPPARNRSWSPRPTPAPSAMPWDNRPAYDGQWRQAAWALRRPAAPA